MHLMVASLKWDKPSIRYRRHRLAEYLLAQADTKALVWVYPVSATPKKPKSYFEAKNIMRSNPYNSKGGIKEWALPDIIPGRYMQYKNYFGHPQFVKFKNHIDDYEAKKILWFTYPLFPFLVDMLKWDAIIYDCSDLWIEPSGGLRSRTFSSRFAQGLIESAEKKIIKRSNVVFASSDYLAERIEKISGQKAFVIENGVDSFYFNFKSIKKYSCFGDIPKPRLGYVGALRGKNDVALLDETAAGNPDWSIVLVGPNCLNNNSCFSKMLTRKNVFWVDEVEPENLPGYIRSLDIGLLPYRNIEYNRAVFPIKFYEYLSQGIPMVGCGVPSTAKYVEKGVYIHVKREFFQEACKDALSWSAGGDPYVAKRIKIAQDAVWENKLAAMLGKVREGFYTPY